MTHSSQSNPTPTKHSHAFESLEARTFLSGSAPVAPTSTSAISPLISLARRLVVELTPENNLYDTPTVVTWQGINGATVTKNVSVCSTLITALLKQAYGFSSTKIAAWTGETSPEAEDYYDAAVAGNGLTRVNNIANLKVGDTFVAKYIVPPDGSTATGHIAIVNKLPALISTTSTTRTYSLNVIDSSSSYHGNADTRNRIDPGTGEEDDGVGMGTMRMETNLAGQLIRYSWSTLTSSIMYDATERPSLFATLPWKTDKQVVVQHRPGNTARTSTISRPESPFASVDQKAGDRVIDMSL